jgi:TetR/AcrR family transcriptional regulator, regulator of cefoperazone and chloramphenicol sensitivity
MNATTQARTAAVPEEFGRGAQSRLALIRAGMEVFGENSLDGATTREIAHRAQQNIAAIAYYFGGKEGLYLAVVEHIVEIILGRMGRLLDEIEAFLAGAERPPERSLELLTRFFASSLSRNEELVAVTNIIVREQTHPTKAFAILYDGCLERLQRLGAALVAGYIGCDPAAEEATIRFHALLGESLAFRFARETIIRRAGWTAIGEREEAAITAVVAEHTELVLRGLRARTESQMRG